MRQERARIHERADRHEEECREGVAEGKQLRERFVGAVLMSTTGARTSKAFPKASPMLTSLLPLISASTGSSTINTTNTRSSTSVMPTSPALARSAASDTKAPI